MARPRLARTSRRTGLLLAICAAILIAAPLTMSRVLTTRTLLGAIRPIDDGCGRTHRSSGDSPRTVSRGRRPARRSCAFVHMASGRHLRRWSRGPCNCPTVGSAAFARHVPLGNFRQNDRCAAGAGVASWTAGAVADVLFPSSRQPASHACIVGGRAPVPDDGGCGGISPARIGLGCLQPASSRAKAAPLSLKAAAWCSSVSAKQRLPAGPDGRSAHVRRIAPVAQDENDDCAGTRAWSCADGEHQASRNGSIAAAIM